MSKKEHIYIKIEKHRVECGFRAYYKKRENQRISWFIPGYNIRFSSENMELGEIRAKKMIRYFVSYWKNNGTFREFVLEIHRLGFKAPVHHELTVSKLLRHKVNTATFKSIALVPHADGYRSKSLSVTAEAA